MNARRQDDVPLARDDADDVDRPLGPRLDNGLWRSPAQIMLAIEHAADRSVAKHYGPPAMAVDANLRVVLTRGEIDPYLSKPGSDIRGAELLDVVRPELRDTTASLVQSNPSATAPREARVELPSLGRHVIVDAFSLGGIAGGFHFVAFRDVPPSGAEPPAHSAADALEAQIAMARELLMESKQRLVAAKEELESVGHDLRCSNDRLRATNIDLMASREEARAFHQNLKERNELLFDHVRGFVCDGDDVANVLTALQNPFLLVDRDGRIRKVSRSAEQSFGLTTEDLGRPISLVADIVGAPALTEAVLKAITQGARSELGVERPTGCFYLVAVVPYDLSGTKGGALVEFIIDRP